MPPEICWIFQTQHEAFAWKRSEDRNVPKGSLLLGLIVNEELGIVNSLCQGAREETMHKGSHRSDGGVFSCRVVGHGEQSMPQGRQCTVSYPLFTRCLVREGREAGWGWPLYGGAAAQGTLLICGRRGRNERPDQPPCCVK